MRHYGVEWLRAGPEWRNQCCRGVAATRMVSIVRFADGTQICGTTVTIDFGTRSSVDTTAGLATGVASCRLGSRLHLSLLQFMDRSSTFPHSQSGMLVKRWIRQLSVNVSALGCCEPSVVSQMGYPTSPIKLTVNWPTGSELQSMKITIHPVAGLPGQSETVASVSGDTLTVDGVEYALGALQEGDEGTLEGDTPFVGPVTREGGQIACGIIWRYDLATAEPVQPAVTPVSSLSLLAPSLIPSPGGLQNDLHY